MKIAGKRTIQLKSQKISSRERISYSTKFLIVSVVCTYHVSEQVPDDDRDSDETEQGPRLLSRVPDPCARHGRRHVQHGERVDYKPEMKNMFNTLNTNFRKERRNLIDKVPIL